jgi:hypothetical protein
VSERLDSEHELAPEERRLAEHVQAARPVPAAGFRGALGRYLAEEDPGHGPRPPRLRLISSTLIASGAALLAVGALQASGAL